MTDEPLIDRDALAPDAIQFAGRTLRRDPSGRSPWTYQAQFGLGMIGVSRGETMAWRVYVTTFRGGFDFEAASLADAEQTLAMIGLTLAPIAKVVTGV